MVGVANVGVVDAGTGFVVLGAIDVVVFTELVAVISGDPIQAPRTTKPEISTRRTKRQVMSSLRHP